MAQRPPGVSSPGAEWLGDRLVREAVGRSGLPLGSERLRVRERLQQFLHAAVLEVLEDGAGCIGTLLPLHPEAEQLGGIGQRAFDFRHPLRLPPFLGRTRVRRRGATGDVVEQTVAVPMIDALRAALQRTIRGSGAGSPFSPDGRVSGPPRSSNGASSMHLRWAFAGNARPRFREVSVVFTVVDPPTVPALYFWALQASFGAGGRSVGAAHMGLQHHPRYPGSGAVNWGGYRHGGGELEGSASMLPSTLGNVNTSDYRWRTGAAYRYHIAPAPDRGWRATITDLERGEATVIRDLWSPEHTDELSDIVVWSEVFADCDAPSVRVEWSQPEGVTADGTRISPVAMTTSFQSHHDGGCANTTAVVVEGGIAQITSTGRTVAAGTPLPLS